MTEADQAELRYLRRQLDELAAENLKLAHRADSTRRELDIRRRAFSLLARLTKSLGPHEDMAPALGAVLPIVEAELGVQRTLALRLIGGAYVPFAWTGFPAGMVDALSRAHLPLAEPLARSGVVVTKRESGAAWLDAVREALEVPAFVAVPVASADHALLVARLDERAGFYPRFVDADRNTLCAVAELVAAAVENTRLAGVRELRRFLPPSVAEEVISGRLAPGHGHDRREVTLLFADMVGSTQLAESLHPDALAGVLDAYLRDMTTLAHAHGGTVGSVAGDGLLVIFGAPEHCAPAVHAGKAAQAAFAMRARVSVLGAELGGEASGLQVRIGLNTGTCAVGVFGSDTQRTYTAIGTAVNIAARIEGAAAPGEILASPTTRALLGDDVRPSFKERVRLKGVSSPLAVSTLEPLAAGRRTAPGQAPNAQPDQLLPDDDRSFGS